MRVHPKMSIISKAVVPGASAQVTVRQMTSARKSAEIAAAALAKMLRDSNDSGRVADIVESVLTDANREQEEQERRHVVEVEAAAATRLARLLDASPAVIYSFEAKGDFAPTFVSENIARLFGYAASEYLDNPNFWRERVHPDDLPRLEAEMSALFERGQHVRVSLPQEGRRLLLGERRSAPDPRRGRRAVGGGGLVERYQRPQGRGGGRGPGPRSAGTAARYRARGDLQLQGKRRLRADLRQ